MPLLSELENRSSRISRFFDATLPDVKAVSVSYRAQRPSDGDVLRPNPPDGTTPDWGTIGSAIDHRLRYAFAGSLDRCYSVNIGMFLAWQRPARRSAGNAVFRLTLALPGALERVADMTLPSDRAKPMLLPKRAEERLDRICYALTWFEQVYRYGPPRPGNPLAAAGPDFTMEAMLAAVPDYAAKDMAAQVELAERPLADLRAQTDPSDVVNGPRFAGSPDIGNADADMIIGDVLLDVKATVNPKSIGRVEFYQLLGYALLDYDDEYGIQRVGLYLSRSGTLITWGLEEYVRLFGCTTPVDKVRRQLAEALGRE